MTGPKPVDITPQTGVQPRWMNKYLGGQTGVWAALAFSTVALFVWHRYSEHKRLLTVTEDQRDVSDTKKFADAVRPYPYPPSTQEKAVQGK